VSTEELYKLIYEMIDFNDYLDEAFPPPPISRIDAKDDTTLLLVFNPFDSMGNMYERVVSLKYVGESDIIVASNNVNLLVGVVSALRLIGGKPSLPFVHKDGKYMYFLVWSNTEKILAYTERHLDYLMPLEQLPAPTYKGYVYTYDTYPDIEYITPHYNGVPVYEIIGYRGGIDFVEVLKDTYKGYLEKAGVLKSNGNESVERDSVDG